MTELTFLHIFLSAGVVMAPRMTQMFFLGDSVAYQVAHTVALIVMGAGFVTDTWMLFAVWPLFCLFGFGIHLWNRHHRLIAPANLASYIPFVFSLISSTWLFAGANDMELLGYDPTWSFYAALHGTYLGWMLIGGIAYLAHTFSTHRFYLLASFLGLALFLCVAFGIDGVPHLKRVGVVGFALLLPLVLMNFIRDTRLTNARAATFASVSLASLAVTLTLAVLYEFYFTSTPTLFGIPIMVNVHGALNAFVTLPFFLLALNEVRNRPTPLGTT